MADNLHSVFLINFIWISDVEIVYVLSIFK